MSPLQIKNDHERQLWVENDQGLYNWWKSSRQGITTFVRENREELDAAIARALNQEPAS